MAYLIKSTSLKAEEIKPKNGKYFTLEELQHYVGGHIEYCEAKDGKELVCNEEGKCYGARINLLATCMYKWTTYSDDEGKPILNDVICGDVVYGDLSELDSPDEDGE